MKMQTLSTRLFPSSATPSVIRRTALLPLALLLVACDPADSTSSDGDNARNAELSSEEGESEQEKKGHHSKKMRRHGPEMLVRIALEKLDLSDEQKEEIQSLQEGLRQNKVDRHEDRAAMAQILADGVRAGAIDSDAVDAQLDLMESSASEQQQAVIDALNALHGILDAEQRATLVEPPSKEDRGGDKEGKPEGSKGRPGEGGPSEGRPAKGKPGEGPRGEGAPPEGDRPDKASSSEGPQGDKAGRHGPPGMRLVKALELSEEQIEALKEAMGEPPAKPEKPDMEAHKERRQAFAEAFASDSFDASDWVGSDDRSQHAREHAEHFVNLVTQLLAIVDSDQQSLLADLLEEGPQNRPQDRHMRD